MKTLSVALLEFRDAHHDFVNLILKQLFLTFMGDGDFFKLRVADDDRVIVPGSDTRTEFLAVARFKIFFVVTRILAEG